jgi:hypothetical protein
MAEVQITMKPTRRATAFCPLSAELEMPAEQAREHCLTDCQRGVTIPFQAEPAGPESCRIYWILDRAPAGQERRFVLGEEGARPGGPTVDLIRQDGQIQVDIGGETFTRYHYGEDVPRPVLYPIIGPFGKGVTRPYPMEIVDNDHTDHPHHRSVWVAWGDVNDSDNWSEEEHAGRVVHRKLESCHGGPVFGQICSINDWVSAEEEKLMEDRMTYRFYNLPGGVRFVDMEVEFTATEGPVRFGDTKEGGICSVRVAAPMEVDRGGRIENSFGGVDEPETWGKRAHWCDYNGVVGDRHVGIAIFDHPSNFRHPTYWHVRNYGLMTANPFGLSYFRDPEPVDGSHSLDEGESMVFRYGVYVHAGDAEEGGVGARYLDWIYPPQASTAD